MTQVEVPSSEELSRTSLHQWTETDRQNLVDLLQHTTEDPEAMLRWAVSYGPRAVEAARSVLWLDIQDRKTRKFGESLEEWKRLNPPQGPNRKARRAKAAQLRSKRRN